jgi:hypothetical protein
VTRWRPPCDRRQYSHSDRATDLGLDGNVFRLPGPPLVIRQGRSSARNCGSWPVRSRLTRMNGAIWLQSRTSSISIGSISCTRRVQLLVDAVSGGRPPASMAIPGPGTHRGRRGPRRGPPADELLVQGNDPAGLGNSLSLMQARTIS